MNENEVSKVVLESAIKVHRTLGPGLLESIYKECLAFELRKAGLIVECEKRMPIIYEKLQFEKAYRIDLLVENKLIVELKSNEQLQAIHVAQVLTYLKLSEIKLALLMNFNCPKLVQGVRRIINGQLD